MRDMSTAEILFRLEHCRAELEALRSGRMRTRVITGASAVDSTEQTIAELQTTLSAYRALLTERLPDHPVLRSV